MSRLIAVGDIHGCLAELQTMLDYLKPTVEDRFVFVGDYVDRGLNSAGVLDLLIEFREKFPKSIFLRGNHEDMFLSFIKLKGMYGEFYLQNGGLKYFQELGIEEHVESYRDRRCDMVDRIKPSISVEDFKAKIPSKHLEFILATERHYQDGKFFFVHAGLNNWKTLEDQDGEDLFWIREGFLGLEHKFPFTVVHGHTITPEQLPTFNLPYEINIDTGCFMGLYKNEKGALTAIELDSNVTSASVVYQVKFSSGAVTLPFNKI